MAGPVGADTPMADPAARLTADDYREFDRYAWSKKRAFLLVLIETLGGAGALVPSPTHEGTVAFCRTVFFLRRTGQTIKLLDYLDFLDSHPEYPSIDRELLAALYTAKQALDASDLVNENTPSTSTADAFSPRRLIVEAIARGPVINPFGIDTPWPPLPSTPSAPSVPSWQSSAPQNELIVPRAAVAPDATGGDAPYSDRFAQVVEAVQTGQELEGIRHIPDTVVRQDGITPVGKLKAPKKPWETANSGEASESSSSSALDTKFPDLNLNTADAGPAGESSSSSALDPKIPYPDLDVDGDKNAS